MLLNPRPSTEKITDLRLFLLKDSMRFHAHFKSSIKHDVKLTDFEKKALIGVGSFGRVYLVLDKQTQSYYALKQIEKKYVVEQNHLQHMWYEKRVLQSTNFPFIINLVYYFFDNSYIYFVSPFLVGGELFNLLRKTKKFDESVSQFYAAQVLLALEYLHYMKIAHRDLKLENIMIDGNGYIKLIDLGACKLIQQKTFSICGTPEYLAPEVIMKKGYGLPIDWWSFGVMIYEMNNGTPPFQHWDQTVLYENILQGKYTIPSQFSNNLKDLIKRLLVVDLTKRLGNLKNGANDIKIHSWFRTIVWLKILNREVVAPYVPSVHGPEDTSHFSTYPDEDQVFADEDTFKTEFANF